MSRSVRVRRKNVRILLRTFVYFSLDLVRVPPSVAKLLYRGAAVRSEDQYERERTKFPERRVGAVLVHGSDSFLSDVSDSLAQLQRKYPYGYSLVQRYIRGIIQS